MSVHTVTFGVDDVDPVSPVDAYQNKEFKTPKEILSKLIDTNPPNFFCEPRLEPKPYFEAVVELEGDYYETEINSFFRACSDAYARHLPLELDVDHVKLTIVQAFAIHVNENSETLRKLLVNHENKKKIIVDRDDFIRGSIHNDWTEVFHEFADRIKEDINDTKLVKEIQSPTQTTTTETMAALNVSIMDCFQKFYDYTLITMCGIPNITLRGSVDDWKSLKSLLSLMEKYDFDWYTDKMQTIIDEFISAAEGTPNTDYWKNMVKYKDMSGGPYYQGWIKYFFPYLKKRGGGHKRSDFNEDFTIISIDIPSGLSSVPITWKYNELSDDTWKYYKQEFELKFCAGFAGIKLSKRDDLAIPAITPGVMWCIQDIEKSENNYDIPNIPNECIETYLKGTYFNPAENHYEEGTRVVCDLCKKDIRICIGYKKNRDLCLDCIAKIHTIVNKSSF